MKILLLKGISKKYEIGKGKFFTALRPTNLSFNSTGLVAIVGKSGSGKSTLINIIARIDKPTKGEILYCGKEYSKYSKKEIESFYNKEIGIVFQQYNLLEDKTALFNVQLPMLIGGASKKESEKEAKELLKSLDISESLFSSFPNKLSGGESQRVAIARAIANKPKILLCDEPTGALDSTNSRKVMDIFKRISKDRLVIIVSHNLQLVNEYADRIIEIADGSITKDIKKDNIEIDQKFKYSKKKSSSYWINKIASKNYKRRIKRNLLSSLALVVTLSMLYVVCGFVNNKDNAIKDACYKQFDFGAGSISYEIKTGGSGMLNLTRQVRPALSTLTDNHKISEKYEICINCSAILPQNIQICYDFEPIDDLLYTPIYSFEGSNVDPELITIGELPKTDSLSEVVINKTAYDIIKREIGKEPFNERLQINHESIATYVSEEGEYISDTFNLNTDITIIGVVNEINYLPSPRIYYSYSALSEYLKESVLNNLSTYTNTKITWYDRIANADPLSYISSYSYQLFLKDYKDKEYAYRDDVFIDGLVYTSQSLILADSLFNFLQVAEYGVVLFLIITFIGTILILSIISFTSFSEDHKNSAILSSLGASNEEIQDIYLQESLINCVISFFVSTFLSILLSKLINLIINRFVDIHDLIKIPIMEFMGIKFLFPLIIFMIFIFITILSTLIPISFSKHKSIKGELQSL